MYHYDASGRTISLVLPDGSTTTYNYDGNWIGVTDPAGKWKAFGIDAFGNLLGVQETDPALGTVLTSYTYDVLNHLIEVSMSRGSTGTQTRTFNYNNQTSPTTVVTGFLQTTTNPENGTVTYSYNPPTNELASKTDANGTTLRYGYDNYNRLTQVTATPRGGQQRTLRTFTYDANTDPTFPSTPTSYSLGRLTSVQNFGFTPGNGSGINSIGVTEEYGYTQAGQVAIKRLQIGEQVNGGSLLTQNLDAYYAYDSEGNVTGLTYPTTYGSSGAIGGPAYNYTYDSMSRLSGITYPWPQNTAVISNVSYDAANRLLGFFYPTTNPTAQETRRYNSLEQLTQLTTPGGSVYSYNYPAGTNNGKISSAELPSGETITYQYDSLNRLSSASGTGWGDTYTYDGFGNLLHKNITQGSAPSLSQAVNTAYNQIVGQSYDANGNQLTAPGVTGTLTYDVENRLIAAPGVQYGYDSKNKRVWSGTLDSNGNLISQTAYFYGVDGARLEECSLTVSGTNLYDPATETDVYFAGRRVLINGNANSEDRLGSNASVGNAFYPWGEGRGLNPQDTWSFASYWRDSATQLDYANNRYYSNAYGRFMTPDPNWSSAVFASPQSWNRYSYVSGDPVNHNDPLGLCDAVIGGITEGPGSDSGEGAFAAGQGADVGYPYAGTNVGTGVGAVALTTTASVFTALSEILAAANDSSGPINITTFSGGAGAFAGALQFLPSSVVSRIASITYVSPGSPYGLPTVPGVTPTVILGTGIVDNAATAGTPIPNGYNKIQTTCGHDFACEIQQAEQKGWQVPSGNPCENPSTFVPNINSTYQWIYSLASSIMQSVWASTPYVGPSAPTSVWFSGSSGDGSSVTSCWTDTNGVQHCS